jgi:retron-type reverse transcriptase
MNIGEMQRKLSSWAAQDKGRRFYGLYNLICEEHWLRLAKDYVAQNAGNKTAGCDGLDMGGFEADEEGNLRRLREALQTGTFAACPVRRVYNRYKRPVDANRLKNLWTLCIECH